MGMVSGDQGSGAHPATQLFGEGEGKVPLKWHPWTYQKISGMDKKTLPKRRGADNYRKPYDSGTYFTRCFAYNLLLQQILSICCLPADVSKIVKILKVTEFLH